MENKGKIKKVVYVPIVADLFHYGHLQSIKFASSQGDYLICGLLTDEAAKYYKKSLISNFEERKAIISSLSFVDDVMPQNDKDPTQNLKDVKRKFRDAQLILVHGDDWRTIPGAEYINGIGGRVITHPYYTNLSEFKIIHRLLERYNGKFKSYEDFIRYFKLKDFTYFNPRKGENAFFSSKADSLRFLKLKLKKSKIEDAFVFTVFDWKEEKDEIISRIMEKFSPSNIVVRSSSLNEDAISSSMAGYFHSELNVPSVSKEKIEEAINKVIQSYNEKKSEYMINQLLVQPHTSEVIISGVVLTRTIGKNAPYFVVNYDDISGKTDSVTKGLETKSVKIYRHCDKSRYPKKFMQLMESVEEIESVTMSDRLDIEFAVNKKKEVIIFQVRPLAANAEMNNSMDADIGLKIQQLKGKFYQMSKREPHLVGSRNCFGDMPDWNPAEIIGDSPAYLDYTLYDLLITDSAWHEARASQGYTDVNPAKLVVLFGNKPYVNIRNTFNSFIPAPLQKELKEKLIKFYMDKLESRPELQDKVEFEILYTCYDLSFGDKTKELRAAGFSREEVKHLKNSLVELTNSLICNSEISIEDDMEDVLNIEKIRHEVRKELQDFKDNPNALLKGAQKLLEKCRRNGTVQFSRLARLAFIGDIILKSLVAKRVIGGDFYYSYMNSIYTVAKKMNRDFNLLIAGKLSKENFLKDYGHLRPGTYDITSSRYDKNPKLFSKASLINSVDIESKHFLIKSHVHDNVDKIFKKHNLKFSSRQFFSFVRKAIESRELSKFEFTKGLSDAIELIAEAGEILGYTRKDMSYLGIDEIFQYIFDVSNKTPESWKQLVSARIKEYDLSSCLVLPPIIFYERDFEIISYYSIKPNFITPKKVEGELINISNKSHDSALDLNGKIVLLENGDPGYDWIFTKNIAGLITKFGGVASHMSIRSAEFGLPAAIGCGEIFDTLKTCGSAILDCGAKKIVPIR